MAYEAIYNKQARQWDVVNGSGEIVAMCGGGRRGEENAKHKASNLTFIEESLAICDRMKAILNEPA